MDANESGAGYDSYSWHGLKTFLALFYLLLSGCGVQVLSTAAWSPDGTMIVAAGSNDVGKPAIYLYDAATLNELGTLRVEKEKQLSGETGAVFERRPVAFSFDSRFLAAAGRRYSVDVLEFVSRRQVTQFPQLAGAMAIAFSPTANVLAVAGPTSETTVWAVPDGKLLAVLRGKPTSPNTAVTFSPDGKILAVGDADRTVRLWALADGREIGVLRDHEGWVHSLSFSSDGKTLAVYAGQLKFWRLPEMRALPLFPELSDLAATATRGHPGIFSPDSKLFAYLRTYVTYLLGLEGGASEVVVFNLESKKTLRIDCRCMSFAFSSDSSKLITVPGVPPIASPFRIYNPVTGARIQ